MTAVTESSCFPLIVKIVFSPPNVGVNDVIEGGKHALVPDVPLVPEVPAVLLVPDVPDVPLVPEVHAVPLVPDVPDVPLVPELPLAPSKSGNPKPFADLIAFSKVSCTVLNSLSLFVS